MKRIDLTNRKEVEEKYNEYIRAVKNIIEQIREYINTGNVTAQNVAIGMARELAKLLDRSAIIKYMSGYGIEEYGNKLYSIDYQLHRLLRHQNNEAIYKPVADKLEELIK